MGKDQDKVTLQRGEKGNQTYYAKTIGELRGFKLQEKK